jgi:hypothetical protein
MYSRMKRLIEHSIECTSSPKYLGAGTEALILLEHARVRNLLPNLDSKPCAVFFTPSQGLPWILYKTPFGVKSLVSRNHINHVL